MSAELYTVSGPGGNDASLQGITVGGSKPLHRFMKGQPKTIGVVVLVFGSSLFIISVTSLWKTTPTFILQGILFIMSGIMYILTEHNPNKKTVTVSLALSIVSILVSLWTDLYLVPELVHSHYDIHYFSEEERLWTLHYQAMAMCLEGIIVCHSFVGTIILIVMSTLAGAALRSTKSQAVVMMTAAPTETPAE